METVSGEERINAQIENAKKEAERERLKAKTDDEKKAIDDVLRIQVGKGKAEPTETP